LVEGGGLVLAEEAGHLAGDEVLRAVGVPELILLHLYDPVLDINEPSDLCFEIFNYWSQE
jgi:hypothetical protein